MIFPFPTFFLAENLLIEKFGVVSIFLFFNNDFFYELIRGGEGVPSFLQDPEISLSPINS